MDSSVLAAAETEEMGTSQMVGRKLGNIWAYGDEICSLYNVSIYTLLLVIKLFSYDSKTVFFFLKELNKIQLFIKEANGLAEETSLHPLIPSPGIKMEGLPTLRKHLCGQGLLSG